ncbi:hypothetical protein J437_LFUL004214 [Ladona fulva]|uniref:G patch domain-containing protein 11 n=1 Tax=Ladona fulva TaxID=123851 RepID=A0A8K0NWR8_LADFU|nr:hypothetical protein J437_LFUL004214 [Ladona fulva]
MRKHRTCDHYEQATISLPSKPSKKDRSIALDKYVFGDFRYTKRGKNSAELEESSSETTSDDEDDQKSKTKRKGKKKNAIDDSEGPPTDTNGVENLSEGDTKYENGDETETDHIDDENTKDTSNLEEQETERRRYRVNRPLWYDSKRRSSSSEDAEFMYDLDEEEEEEEQSESESSEEASSHGEFDEEVWRFAKLTREIEKQNKAEEERISKGSEEIENISNKQLEVPPVSEQESYPEAGPDLHKKSQFREPRIETLLGPRTERLGARPESRKESPQKSHGKLGKGIQLEQKSRKDPRMVKRAQSKRGSRSRSKSRSKKRSKSRERAMRRIREMDMHKWWFHGLGYDMEYSREKSFSWILGPTTNDVVIDAIATCKQLFGTVSHLCGCADNKVSIDEIAAPNLKPNTTEISTPAPDKEPSSRLKHKTTPPVTHVAMPSPLEAETPAPESAAPAPALEPPLEEEKPTPPLEERRPTPPLATKMPMPSLENRSLTKSSEQETPNPSQELERAPQPLEAEMPRLSLEENSPTFPLEAELLTLEDKCPTPPSITRTPNISKEISSKDVRPGLIQDRSKQRLIEIEKRKSASDEENKKRHKSQASLEAERREEGLQEAIPADNKGFELLQKMGYKPGEALGKTVKGPIVPVKIEVKGDRSGLGRKSSTKLVMEAKKRAEEKTESLEESKVTTQDFRKRITSDVKRRHAETDLVSSQRACYNLDLENGYDEPVKRWYWPVEVIEKVDEALKDYEDQVYGRLLGRKRKRKDSKEEDIAEDEEIGTDEKLAELTEYLRSTYFYCVWCGATFSGKSDIAKYCPGPSRELH